MSYLKVKHPKRVGVICISSALLVTSFFMAYELTIEQNKSDLSLIIFLFSYSFLFLMLSNILFVKNKDYLVGEENAKRVSSFLESKPHLSKVTGISSCMISPSMKFSELKKIQIRINQALIEENRVVIKASINRVKSKRSKQ